MTFLERPFVALEDLRSVVPVSQGFQRIAVGQPAIKIDFAIIPVELPKILRDSSSLPFQPRQAGRCRLRLWYRRRVVGHSPTMKLVRYEAALALEQITTLLACSALLRVLTRSWGGLWTSNQVRFEERATAPPIYGPCWDRLN
jgi:hypothetical protein